MTNMYSFHSNFVPCIQPKLLTWPHQRSKNGKKKITKTLSQDQA